MRKWLNDKNTVPAGGFRFTDPETQKLITAPTWRDLVLRVKAHRIANNIPIQLNIEDDIEAQLAGAVPENFTSEVNPNRTAVVPRDQWPMWAKLIAMKAIPEDKGVGDTTARLIGPERGERFTAWFKETFNRDCGCGARHHDWNVQYPYSAT